MVLELTINKSIKSYHGMYFLDASGRVFASQFCYVTAQVEFSSFRPEAKLVLLGSSHNQNFAKFATCRAVMLTMCYEYGLKLKHPTFSIPTLQVCVNFIN